MWHFKSIHREIALAVLSAGLMTGGATAAEPGDPSRWYKADRTYAERVATSRKEAYAAYKEALDECKKFDRQDRPACIAQAKAALKRDLDYAQRQPEPVAFLSDQSEESPASMVRRQLAMLMVGEMECETR
jgi:hypothetical protein